MAPPPAELGGQAAAVGPRSPDKPGRVLKQLNKYRCPGPIPEGTSAARRVRRPSHRENLPRWEQATLAGAEEGFPREAGARGARFGRGPAAGLLPAGASRLGEVSVRCGVSWVGAYRKRWVGAAGAAGVRFPAHTERTHRCWRVCVSRERTSLPC